MNHPVESHKNWTAAHFAAHKNLLMVEALDRAQANFHIESSDGINAMDICLMDTREI